MSRIELVDVRRRLAGREELRRRANATAMNRVAARLPACVIAPVHCAIHNKHEAGPLGTEPASTTSTDRTRLDGCS